MNTGSARSSVSIPYSRSNSRKSLEDTPQILPIEGLPKQVKIPFDAQQIPMLSQVETYRGRSAGTDQPPPARQDWSRYVGRTPGRWKHVAVDTAAKLAILPLTLPAHDALHEGGMSPDEAVHGHASEPAGCQRARVDPCAPFRAVLRNESRERPLPSLRWCCDRRINTPCIEGWPQAVSKSLSDSRSKARSRFSDAA